MAYSPVPIEDIRASRMTFEDFIMRCFDRMDMVLPECVKDNNYKIADAKIRLIHSTSRFFHKDDADYNQKLEKIKTKLAGMGGWDYDYYKALMEWIELLSDKFQKMNIIGPISSSIWMGRGPKPDWLRD